jgi:hypothetical protein
VPGAHRSPLVVEKPLPIRDLSLGKPTTSAAPRPFEEAIH